MSSFWLCCDPEPAKDLKQQRKEVGSATRTSSPFLGIFTEDPAVIGRKLPRPVTPFAPLPPVNTSNVISKSKDAVESTNICESPPATGFGFEFEDLHKRPAPYLISIF